MRRVFWVAVSLMMPSLAIAQCPAASFVAPATACAGESIYLENSSLGASSYRWDFCGGDLGQTPAAGVTATDQSLFRARTFRMISSGGNWYGFAIDQNAFLVRLDFGADPRATPALVNLGNPQNAISLAYDMALWQEGSSWFALVANTASDNLLLLSFGTNVQSSPSVTNLGSLGGALKSPAGIQLMAEGNSVFALISNSGTPEVVRLNFGSSILNTPSATVFTLPSAVSLRGVDVARECDHVVALIADNGGNQLFYLDFQNGIAGSPSAGALAIAGASYSFPSAVALRHEGGNYVAFVQSGFPSNLYRIDFGTSILDLAGTFTDLGNFNINSAPLNAQFNGAFDLIQTGSTWTAYSMDLSGPDGNGRLLRLSFPNVCGTAAPTSSLAEPTLIYSGAGTYRITLTALAPDGMYSSQSELIAVSGLPAPDIDFSSTNNCVIAPIQFNAINTSGNLTAFAWDFGDSQGSTSENPLHTYSSPGVFESRLTVTSSNGCSNSVVRSLEVFAAPAADFLLPGTSPVCTNQDYTFANTSTYNPASMPSWEWRVNGTLVSTQQDLTTVLVNPVLHEIRLKASIPGCNNEVTKTLPTVLTGPLVSFSADDDCAMNSVLFTNASSGADTGFSWDFDDGSPGSTQVNPAHVFSTPGNYTVTLTASNSAGCNNFTSRNVVIFSVPQPDFTVGAPPFSCSNNPTLFQNLTPPLTDSNITDWLWSFGDPASSSSAAQAPSFVYTAGGSYTVSLTATSDAGCSNTVVEAINIGTSPVADFVSGPACINAPTQFSDISSGGVQSRVWQIGSSTFTSTNPAYTYTAPGNYTATLTVTGPGGCTNLVTKPINVPQPPTVTLQVENPCEDQPAVFTWVDTVLPPAGDAVSTWQWNIGGTSVSGNPAVAILTLSGTTPVSVITTHVSGCSYTQFYNTVIHPSPVADFLASPDRGNAPLTVQFENLSSGATEYQWIFNDKTPATSTASSPVYTFLELGDFTAELTAINSFGCSDSKLLPIQVLVPEIDLEVTSFSLLPDGATGKLRPTLTILNVSNIPIASAEVVLHLSDRANISEAMTVNLSPGASVTKALSTVVDPGQFADPFVCVQVVSEKDITPGNNKSCINFSSEDYLFEPYPNPTTGRVQLDWVCDREGTAAVTVYNSQGRVDYYWETASQQGLNQSVHDLSFLAAGIYFVTVRTSTSIQTSRIIRQ